jgi:cytochrome c
VVAHQPNYLLLHLLVSRYFQERGCVACHGPTGEGGARAPDIAPLIAKAADAQVTQLLQSPNAKMKAGGMPPVSASPTEIGSLVAYLRTLAAPQPGKESPRRKAHCKCGRRTRAVAFSEYLGTTTIRPLVGCCTPIGVAGLSESAIFVGCHIGMLTREKIDGRPGQEPFIQADATRRKSGMQS